MTEKIIISHPDTLKGFAAAYAAWFGLTVAIAPDKERPEVEFAPHRVPMTEGTTRVDLHEICEDTRHAPSETWEQMVPDFPTPDILRYIEDDQLTLPASKEVRAYLATIGRTADDLRDWVEFDRQIAAFAGAAILRFAALLLAEQAAALYERV